MKQRVPAEPAAPARRALRPAEPLRLPRSLPRGNHRLARDVVLMSQRSRLIEGMVAAVAAKGYAATTVADVCAHAGVSRATFYEQFADKEDCFLAAYDAGARVHFEHVAAAGRQEEDAFLRLRGALRVFLEVLAAEPDYARTFILEIVAAGPRALERRLAAHRRFVELLQAWHERVRAQRPEIPAPSDEMFVAAVGAITELVADRVRHDLTARLADLEPVLLRVVTTLLGAQALLETGRVAS